jgi:hypothetical protein
LNLQTSEEIYLHDYATPRDARTGLSPLPFLL